MLIPLQIHQVIVLMLHNFIYHLRNKLQTVCTLTAIIICILCCIIIDTLPSKWYYFQVMHKTKSSERKWVTTVIFSKDLNALKKVYTTFASFVLIVMFWQYICTAFKNAERGSHTSFQFEEENNGSVELNIVSDQEEGWSVIPSEEPLKVSYFRLYYEDSKSK